MSTTSSLPGVRAPDWVADDQSLRQLARRSSKLEGGATSTQGQVMPSPEEKTYYPPRTWENLFMVGLLCRLLKFLLDVLLRRSQQSDSDRFPHPHPEPRPGIHTSIGNRNERSGNIRRTGVITVTCKGTAIESGGVLAEGLDGLAKDLLAISARAGHDNIESVEVDDSAKIDINLE